MIKSIGISRQNCEVQAIDIWRDGLSATILTWGAVVQDLRLMGHDSPLVLGFRKFKHYPRYSPHYGAIAGRVANRIANGYGKIGDLTFNSDTNFLGKHSLHGGKDGFGTRDWDIRDHGHDFVELGLRDPDGMMGFPGTLEVVCRYEIQAGNVLSITLDAQTNMPTLCNLAHHSYFCLDDTGDIRGHELQINADSYLPCDKELIPTGEIRDVTGTVFDFRSPRLIGATDPCDYDVNYCLDTTKTPIRPVATVKSPHSGIVMQVASTEPGLQLYTGHKLGPPVPGLDGQLNGSFSGLCLEPQLWPDAPNHPHFPSILLTPNTHYHQESSFSFAFT